MSACYSVRFGLAHTGGVSYTVPAGKRAVVKCVTAYNDSAGPGSVSVFIGSHPVYVKAVPAAQAVTEHSLMIVVNAGERLDLFGVGPVWAHASGFLLDAT